MVGLFKQKSPVNIIVGLIFGLLIKAPLFLIEQPVQVSQTDGPLYRLVTSSLSTAADGGLLASLVAFALLYIQALLLNYLVNEYRLTPRQTYLPAMAYLLLTSLVPEWNYLSAALVANTFIIWAFIQLFRLYNAPKAGGAIYNIGLITGLCSYIYFPAVWITICLLIGILTLRAFRLNELVLLLVGMLTPFYFYAVYLFLTDQFRLQRLVVLFHGYMPVIKTPIWFFIAVALLVVPFLIGGYFVQVQLHKMMIQTRKYWGLLFLCLLITLATPFVYAATAFTNWMLITVPLAAFHASTYYYLRRPWISLALFFITTGVIIYQQYGTALWQ